MIRHQGMDEIQANVDPEAPITNRIAVAAWELRAQAAALGYDIRELQRTQGVEKEFDPTPRIALERKEDDRIIYRIWTNSAKTGNYVQGN